jgi:hypothetical protein
VLAKWGAAAAIAESDLVRLLSDREPAVRVAGCQALWRINGVHAPDAALVLADVLIDPAVSDDVSAAAARALADMGSTVARVAPELCATVRRGRPAARQAAIIALGRIGCVSEQVVSVLTESLKDRETRLVACGAVQQLGSAAASVFPVLVEVLASDDSEERLWALRGIAEMAPAIECVPTRLIGCLHDVDPKVRAVAADVLARMGAKARNTALPTLEYSALNDPYAEVRLSAANALWRVGGDWRIARSVLGSLLKDPDENFVRRVLAVVREIEGEGAGL